MKRMTTGKLVAGIAGATGAGSMGPLAGALIRITAAHAVPAAMWALMAALIVVPAVVASLALILGYRQKKLEIESAAELEKARQEMYRVLLEKSAAAAAGSASYQELVYADAVHLSVERNGAQPVGQMHKSLSGRGSTGPVGQQPVPGRMMPPGQEPGPVTMSQMDPAGDTGECQPRWGRGPLMDEGGGRCLNQPARRPEPPTAGASMDDATAPVPDVPAGEQKTVTSSHGPAGVSKVEYAMVYQAEKPRLVRYLIQCGANSHDADDAAQRALLALYEQWSVVRNRRPWLRKVAFREFIRTRAAEERPLGGRDQLHAALDHAGVESLLEQDAVLSAIRQLSPLQRQVFALHFDQFSTSEIAETLQITDAAVRQNLARARARLKELLGLTQRDLTTARDDPALGSEEGI